MYFIFSLHQCKVCKVLQSYRIVHALMHTMITYAERVKVYFALNDRDRIDDAWKLE